VSGCGAITDDSPAIKVGETIVTLKEFRFSYKNNIEAFQKKYASRIESTKDVDFSKPLYEQPYSEDGKESWADYFSEYTVNSLKNYCILAEDARVNGKTLSDEDIATVNAQIESVEKYIAGLGKTESEYFGENMTIDDYRLTLERNLLGTNRYYEYLDSVTISEQECIEYAESLAENYLALNFYWYDFNAANFNVSYHEAYHVAERFAETLTDNPDDFEKLLYDNVLSESEKESYYEGKYYGHQIPFSNLVRDLQSWAYLEDRNPGDYIIAAGSDGYSIYVFKSLELPDTLTYNFRTIFVSSDDDEYEGGIAASKAHSDAVSILSEFENSGRTEDDFASLATKYSDDSSSAVNGGLYENNNFSGIEDGSAEWMASSERQYGDVEIFDSASGSYILYYIGIGLPEWRVRAENALKATNFNDHIENLASKYHFTTYKNVINKVEKEQ